MENCAKTKSVGRCVVPSCTNLYGAPGSLEFYRVPAKGSKVFPRWTKFMRLSGDRKEKICEAHFTKADFIENSRTKLKDAAVPSLNIPDTDPKIRVGRTCCIAKCTTRGTKHHHLFPTNKQNLRKWKEILHISDAERTAGLFLCKRHFSNSDYCEVTSKYLKAGAVPSKKITQLVRRPRRVIRLLTLPDHLNDHNYSAYGVKARSNRMCFVVGCRSRTEGDIVLHRFPPHKDDRYKTWIHVLKCGMNPTANSRVCSLHFEKSCYTPGGKHLKPDAIPSLRIPGKKKADTSIRSISSGSDPGSPKIFVEVSDDSSDAGSDHNGEESQNANHCSSSSQSTFVDSSCAGFDNDGEEGENADPQHSSTAIQQDDAEFPNIPNVIFDWSCAGIDIDGEDNENTDLEHSSAPSTKAVIDHSKLIASAENDCPTNESILSNAKKTVEKTRDFILPDLLTTDKELNIWTGVPTQKLLEEICLACLKLEDALYSRNFKMHITDRVILVLVKLKQNLSFEALGTLFRISGVTASSYFSHTVQVLARLMERFVYWPTKEEIRQNIPLCFRDHFPNVTVILDCTEIPVATPKCLNCKISCYSNYKSRRTIKFLVGVTPAGMISFISNAYSGRSSDKFIFNDQKLIDRLESHVDEVMVDKGITIENECINKSIKLHIPPFMRGKRLTPDEASRNEEIAKARIHVERAIQRIKVFEITNDCVNPATLSHIDDIMKVICGIVNLTKPILKDDKF